MSEPPVQRKVLTPTEEQRRIIGCSAASLVVAAGAGASKTTSLELYARARPKQKLLYLAYNKAIRADATGRMPANTKCRTTHSIAWGKAVQLFGADPRSRIGNTYPSAIVRAFGCGPLVAKGAIKTIDAWCCSLDAELGLQHVPPEIAERLAEPSNVVAIAQGVWERMCSRDGGDIFMSHDGYLKLFQMDEPVLKGLDGILVDESQDLTLPTYDIVRRQRANIVLVGDEAQRINAYRGSANAMAMHPAEERLSLTRSFRFGPGIAHMANALLGHFKEGESLRLEGAGAYPTRLSIDNSRSFAVLARTNAVLLEEAISHLSTDKPYHFIGGPHGYRLDRVLDGYNLWVDKRADVRDPYLKSFGDFSALREHAEDTREPELRRLVRTVDTYGRHLPHLVEQIMARHIELEKKDWAAFDGIFFSTVHRSKGLEFDQVWLADDFMEHFRDGKELTASEVDPADVCILYVGLTRARRAIRLCETFREWLEVRNFLPAG